MTSSSPPDTHHPARDTLIFHAYIAGATLAELGREHSLSRERVRQILLAHGVNMRTPTDSVRLRHERLATTHRTTVEAEFERLGTIAAVVRSLTGRIPAPVVRHILAPKAGQQRRRPTTQPTRRLSDSHVMSTIRRADTLGIDSAAGYAAWRLSPEGAGAPSLALIQHRYGGWNKARSLAGLPVRPGKGATALRWTDDDIDTAVTRFVTACAATGTTPTERAYTTWASKVDGMPSYSTVRSRSAVRWVELTNAKAAR